MDKKLITNLEQVIDYDHLIHHFKETMQIKLRGHVANVDYLEYWIPDTNIIKSILNMLDAAEAAGQRHIAVKIGNDLITEDEIKKLHDLSMENSDVKLFRETAYIIFDFDNLSGFSSENTVVADTASHSQSPRIVKTKGQNTNSSLNIDHGEIIKLLDRAVISGDDTCTIKLEEGLTIESTSVVMGIIEAYGTILDKKTLSSGQCIKVEGLAQASMFNILPIEYRLGARLKANKLQHLGQQKEISGKICLSHKLDGVELGLRIDPKTKIIVEAWFDGRKDIVQKTILEAFCCVIKGLPFQDASDYSGFKLLHFLRDFRLPRTKSGVNTSANLHPFFNFPVVLIRHFHKKLSDHNQFQDNTNFFEATPSKNWLKNAPEEQSQKIAEAIVKFATHQNLNPSHIIPGAITPNKFGFPLRLTVSYSPELNTLHLGDLTLKLERWLKDTLEGTLQVFCEEYRDKSKLRRLSEGSINKFT